MNQTTPLLDSIHYPEDIRRLSLDQLGALSDEVRHFLLATISQTGGHLGASLGVVELTIALHYAFNTPEDLLVWDVGHQAYVHKILTGRKELLHTIRKEAGISGFLKRSESEYDSFGAGHSSTSISAALGMAVADRFHGRTRHVVAVIGDGAMTAGMAYEALNNAGAMKQRLIVILNDNQMSIAPNVGALKHSLARIAASRPLLAMRHMAKYMAHQLPKPLEELIKKTGRSVMHAAKGASIFEDLGFCYLGPIDGHNVQEMVEIFRNIQDEEAISRPLLLHVITEKGKGFPGDIGDAEKFHAVPAFDLASGKRAAKKESAPSYTRIFAKSLIELAKQDDRILAITAAMPSGTGLDLFARDFPERMFDVGIAEQHAVTFAAGLATQGMIPFVAIYSTFLQRAYDQIIHDVAIQSLPVRFAVDRAGYVGADGPTHAGSFDLTMFCNLPHFVVMAPSDEAELMHMIATAHAITDRPSVVRYPRGDGKGVPLPETMTPLPIGKGRIVRESSLSHPCHVSIVSLGTPLTAMLTVADYIEAHHPIAVTVADARFAKPIDADMITELLQRSSLLLTIEEGAIGGFSAQVTELLLRENLLRDGHRYLPLHYPDYFVDHASAEAQHQAIGMDWKSVVDRILSALACARQTRLE